MANLVEVPAEWVAGIYQLETNDPVIGGADGIDNLQAKQLAKRTAYLKAQVEAAQDGLTTHEAAADPHPAYLTSAEGDAKVAAAVAALVAASPAALDTLNELAAALGNDANFAATITAALATKSPWATLDPITQAAGFGIDHTNLTQVLTSLQTLFSPRSAGAIQFYAMPTAPSGWLKANGAAVSRATYTDLFAAIGTTFGVGDGATTFNLPDLRGEFLRAWDDARGIDAGRAFGSWQKGTLTLIDSTLTTPCVVSPLNGDDVTANTLSRVGVDVAQAANYAPTTSAFISGANVAAIGSGGFEYGSMRPRNIALLACIKY